jgi:hypothetical protein
MFYNSLLKNIKEQPSVYLELGERDKDCQGRSYTCRNLQVPPRILVTHAHTHTHTEIAEHRG